LSTFSEDKRPLNGAWENAMTLDACTAFADRMLGRLPHWAVFLLALLITSTIGTLDYLFGFEISLSIFYLLPIGIATWYGSSAQGVLLAVLSDVPLLLEAGHGYLAGRPELLAWALFLQAGTMLVVVFLLHRIRSLLKLEEALARNDPVTGILNRRGFIERIEFLVHLAAREHLIFALAYLDLDDFKAINDRYGHEEGDRALRVAARVLASSTRHSDATGRLGGDEFALLLHSVDRPRAAILMDELHERFRRAFERERLPLTCSIGCVVFHSAIPDATVAIRAADVLMYEVKQGGKDSVLVGDYPEPQTAGCAVAGDRPNDE
jgi:diguanylate cyclase (GGDEF)-like protein